MSDWIVFSFYGGFAHYLEHYYFTPGTPKNAEFEVMVATSLSQWTKRYSTLLQNPRYVENRESLRAALAEFNGTPLLTLAKLDQDIEGLRQSIRKLSFQF